MGAAFLAGLGVGLWKSTQEVERLWQREKDFEVNWSEKKRKERLRSWHRAIKSVMVD